MAEESQERAERDVTAATEGYGGPVSDEELADVYLPKGQQQVEDTGSAATSGESASTPDAAGDEDAAAPDPAPDASGTLDGAPGQPAIEPPD